MADKAITELVEASQVTAGDLFVLQQDNTAKKLSGQTLINYLLRMIDGHGGITSYEKASTSGLKDTYRFTLADESVWDIVVTNGRAITSVKQTAANGLTRTYTIAFNDNSSETFQVKDGRAISSIEQTGTSGLTRTYTISFNDGSSETFTVTDGRSITGFSKTGTSGLVDTYTLTYNDGTKGTLTVTNGAKGDKGDNAYIWIKYASKEPTASSNSFGDLPDDWIGIYSGTLSGPPVDWEMYTWFKIKGDQGGKGDPATVVSNKVDYQVSASGSIIPSGNWQENVPVVPQGQYLWTRTVTQFNTGNPVTAYSVARFGIDGTGAVSSVANISPDGNGNVPLKASDIGALPETGGDLLGELRMNGQPISGLNPPTAADQAANMGYVDSAKNEANSYTNEKVRNAVPYNYAHNSDFTQFVAQAGIGGKHGNQAYAGDRWILVSGTVTGTANANGDGYSNIKLNGTIRQIVENPPDVGTAAIDMVSGTATIVYEAGEITITSAGGVIKNVRLFKGTHAIDYLAVYRPKGYLEELLMCYRYYFRNEKGLYTTIFSGVATSTSSARANVNLPVPMRLTYPTINISNLSLVEFYTKNGKAIPTAVTSCIVSENNASILFAMPTITVYETMNMRFSNNAVLEIIADL